MGQEVTLYNITEEKVWVDSPHYLSYEELQELPIVSDAREVIRPWDMKIERYTVPIYKHCEYTPYGDKESYVAISHKAQKAFELETDKYQRMENSVVNMKKDKVLAKLCAKNCQDELDKVKRGSFIDKVIWLFTGDI